VQPTSGNVEEEEARSQTTLNLTVTLACSSKSSSALNYSSHILESEQAGTSRLEELESHGFKRDAELDSEVRPAFSDIKEIRQSFATLQGQVNSQNNRINAAIDSNEATQGDFQAWQNRLIGVNNALGGKSLRKSQSIDEGILSKSWTAHVSFLHASQLFSLEKDSSAYKRALSLGLHRTIVIPGTDSA
jgi:hypothetical protein